MNAKKSSESGKEKTEFRPVIAISVVPPLACGVFSPLSMTGIVHDSDSERGRN